MVRIPRVQRRTVGVVAACYVSGLVAVNLVTSPVFEGNVIGSIASHIFPRATGTSQLDTASIQREWQLIQDQYVYRGLTGDKGTNGAEAGIVTELQSLFKLDRFTAFLTKAEYASLTQDLNNSRTGSIGIAVDARCAHNSACSAGTTPTELVISDVLLGMPADRAGVKRGDAIVAVGATRVSSTGISEAELTRITNLIRGASGTTVTLTLRRGAATVAVTVKRADLTIPSVYARRMGSVLYLEVTGFDSDTGDVAKRLLKANLGGVTGIILDLRDNGGGYVSAAQSLASQFLVPGPTVTNVVVRRGRMLQDGDPTTAQTSSYDAVQFGGLATEPTLAVLVNENTASAAEIVAACLHDYHRGTLVGVKTFGKGSVQTDFQLPDGNDLHLTVEKWFGPDGENIDGVGITPDVVVPLANPDDRFRIDAQGADAAADPQVQAALRALKGG